MGLEDQRRVQNIAAWLLNVASGVGLILINKEIMSHYKFIYATCLSALHFITLALAGLAAKLMGFETPGGVPFIVKAKYATAASCAIIGMNFSLLWNSMGFYQVAKLSMIPVTAFMEYIWLSRMYSRRAKFWGAIVMLGVAISTVTDFSSSARGAFTAAVAVLATAVQQIYVGYLQKTYSIGSFDLIRQTAPLQAIAISAVAPFVDYLLTGKRIDAYEHSVPSMTVIAFSCGLAVLGNWSQFLCIGRFDAVSYQVLGHTKTVLVLLLGWTVYDQGVTPRSVGGSLIAVVGMVNYGLVMASDKGVAPTPTVAKQQPVEATPLLTEPKV
eukprot:jgi/Chlat1/7540/Chrsp62S07041